MAKNDKKLGSLSIADLKARRKAKKAEAKAAKQSGQTKRADKIQARVDKIDSAISSKKEEVAQEYTPPTRDDLLQELYGSDRFQMQSPEMQKIIRATIENYSVDDLQNLKIGKKQAQLITKQAIAAAKKEYGYTKQQLDRTHEEALSQDVSNIERAIANQKEQLANDDAQTAEQRTRLIQDLQTSLEQAKSDYEIEANRQNEWLQNQLSDISKELDIATGRADEDKILELRALQRNYNATLRSTQNNMAMRGLAFSGIRAQAEDELSSEYEDSMTTAQLIAARKAEDAQIAAEKAQREATDVTNQTIQNLLKTYGRTQQGNIRDTESVLGTSAVSEVLGSQYNISGASPVNDYLYGGLLGTATNQQSATNLAAKQAMQQNYALFEQQYGTQALKDLGYDSSVYTSPGSIRGTVETQYAKDLKAAKEQRAINKKTTQQTLRQKALLAKMI